MASLSIIKLIWLIQFIVKHEVIGEGKKLTLQNVFTPFSTILFLMITCLFCLYAVKGIGLLLADTEESIPRGILFSIEHFCSTAVLPCYVYYSYLRAGPIFDEVYPYTSKLVSRMVKLAPLLYFAQWIPFPLSRIQYKDPQVSLTLNFIADTISAVNGVLLILFDIVCLTVFIQYLRSTQINEGNTDSRFLIISRYGIMSTIGALSSLGVYILYILTKDELVNLSVIIVFSGIFVVLFRMKVMLHGDKLEKEKERKERIRKVTTVIVKKPISEKQESVNASKTALDLTEFVELKVTM